MRKFYLVSFGKNQASYKDQVTEKENDLKGWDIGLESEMHLYLLIMT